MSESEELKPKASEADTLKQIEAVGTSIGFGMAGIMMLGGLGFGLYLFATGTGGFASLMVVLVFCFTGCAFMPGAGKILDLENQIKNIDPKK